MARRFLVDKVPDATGMSCEEYASGDGEGKFRADPKTHLFSSSTARFKEEGNDEYKCKVGPGSYTPKDSVSKHRHRYITAGAVATVTATPLAVQSHTNGTVSILFVQAYAMRIITRSDWAKGGRFSDAVGAKPASDEAPASRFKIDDYDAATWSRYKADPSVSMSNRMGLGAGRFAVPRFQNSASGVSSANNVGPGQYSPRSVKSDRRNTRRSSSRLAQSSFASKTNRFEEEAFKGALGPGQYGVPKNPRWERGKGELDPSCHRPSASFVKANKTHPRLSKKERHGDTGQLGPGSHWSQSVGQTTTVSLVK